MHVPAAAALASLLLLLAPARAQVYDLIPPPGGSPAANTDTFADRFTLQPRAAGGDGVIDTVCDDVAVAALLLRRGVLTDRQGRIGSIVANRQFQFDGPPAQAGAVYTAGWSISEREGLLYLGMQSQFFCCWAGQCACPPPPPPPPPRTGRVRGRPPLTRADNNLYDRWIGDQCVPCYFGITRIVQC